MRWRAALAALLACTAAHAAPPCPPADESPGEPLQVLAPVLKPGGKLDVLVVGSGVPEGRESYVSEMARALQAAVPGLHVNLTFEGRRFMTAPDLLGVLTAGLARHRYGLVIWQTGTADAVRSEPMGDFYQALSEGASAAATNGAAMVLVDPQFSHFLEANADIAPYLGSMQAIASSSGVLLFDRFAIMRDWAGAGDIDLEAATSGTRLAVGARLHACLGQELAHKLRAAVAPAP